ncbi:MAG: hypothetical protein MUC60_08360 [Oscillatoria sp. Prado101]|nr:hypothetical protein [Oscillatoria sp. Prado101]
MPSGQNLLDTGGAGRLLSGSAGILKSPNTPDNSGAFRGEPLDFKN